MRPTYEPYPLRREHLAYLLENHLVSYNQETSNAVWFGVVLTLSGNQVSCFEVLWNNFLKGNLPLANQRILSASRGAALNVSDVFKKTDVWRKEVIVGDRRGNFWLNVPSEVIRHLESTIRVPSHARALLNNSVKGEQQPSS